MNLAGFKKLVSGTALTDVLVAGFLEREARPAQFHALQKDVVLECGGALLRLSTIGTSGRMRMVRTDSVLSDIPLDDDLELAFASLREAVLDDPDGSNRIRSVKIWDLQEAADGVECLAASFTLTNGQTIFFDPSYHFGIRIRGAAQELIWQENAPEGERNLTEILP